MYVEFDKDQIKAIKEISCEEGVGDIVINRHNMTAEHTEVLGQFLDCTGLDSTELQYFLEMSVVHFNRRTKNR